MGTPVDVILTPLISSLEIENPGVQGGSVAVTGMVRMTWVDERLQWDPAVFGCTQVYVQASAVASQSHIWVPQLKLEDVDLVQAVTMLSTSKAAFVWANGTVVWHAPLRRTMSCTNTELKVPKLCQSNLKSVQSVDEDITSSMVRFHAAYGTEGIGTLPGYIPNLERTNITVLDSGQVIAYIHLDPIDWGCSICAGLEGVTLRNDTIPTSQNVEGGFWTQVVPGQIGWTCHELNEYLSNIPVWEGVCRSGRMTFQEPCCHGLASRKDCEYSVRQYQASMANTIVPPDPTTGTLLNNFREESVVNVTVDLNFEQLLGIDIQTNTLEAVVTLELTWPNDDLAWDPFLGQCHMTSYRASMDAEQTEIWVPEFDLLNQVEGTSGLPVAHASLYELGYVWWRRTGVVKVACELSGIRMFPFDRPSCNLDFGSARDSLVHRTHYTPGTIVGFSERIIEKTSEFQEYQVDTLDYSISVLTVITSGYSNEVLRYQFYFERATRWYMLTFIYLYITFAYLSFGMFLLDHQQGERLGFGASILFVMVAQDITLSEYTPIAQVDLWIDVMGLITKVFVIGGIVESIAVIVAGFTISMLHEHAATKNAGHADKQSNITPQVGDGEEHKEEESNETDKTNGSSSGGSNMKLKDVVSKVTAKKKPKSRVGTSWAFVLDQFQTRDGFLRYRPNPADSIAMRRYRYLRYIDRLMFVFFNLTYTICIIILFMWAM